MLAHITKAKTNWDKLLHNAQSIDDDKESRQPTNPYKTLLGQLYGWLLQLPVIGFNWGKYDLNAMKQFLIPYFLSTSNREEEQEEEDEQDDKEKGEEVNDGVGFFVIKRNNTFMCLSMDQLKFLDTNNYVPRGSATSI